MARPGYTKISAAGATYVYDSHSNAIIKLDPAVEHLFDDYFRLSRDELKSAHPALSGAVLDTSIKFMADAIHQGLFRPQSTVNFQHTLSRDEFHDELCNGRPALCLNVTEECNQLCGYCPQAYARLSGSGKALSRMTWEIARNSLDCFLALTSAQSQVKVVFFGGEPLLNWKLVEQCLHYLRSEHGGRNIQVRVISNLIVLNQNILETLIASDAQLQVSFDGPQHIHDAGRCFGDGRGTHQQVSDQLAEIRAVNPAYFRDNLSLQCTFSKRNDILEVFRYFSEGMFTELPVELNYVTGSFSERFIASPEQAAQHEQRLDQLIEMYLAALQGNDCFRYDLFWNVLHDVVYFGNRTIGVAPDVSWPNGTCVPGAHRLFADSGGTFYPCENFCESGWDLGNHKTGFEFSKAQALFHAYGDLCQKSCQGCWAYRLCTLCFRRMLYQGSASTNECNDHRDRILRALRRFVYIWEHEPLKRHNHPSSLHSQLGELAGKKSLIDKK